jgi:hypothetical protein
MPWTFTLLILSIGYGSLVAQVVDFPKDYQLYPRDISSNKANIHVSGNVDESSGYTEVRLKRYRDGSLAKTINVPLTYNNGSASYDISDQITAELKNYKYSLYGFKNLQETLIKTANNVVAGDAYIVQGQSNATANLRGPFSTANNADDPSNSPNRNFVRVYGNGSTSLSYTHGWFIGRGNSWYDTDGQTGQWGMRLGSNLAGAENIPIAIINGSNPGQRISYFKRNDNNPSDPNTNYGRLLIRITESGLKNNIRAILWHQGESDIVGALSTSGLTTDQYKNAFTDLVNDWKADYPGLSKFYIFQIRFGCGMSSADNALKIQEAQRQLDKESSEILTLGTGNTNQLFDGGSLNYCHYNLYDGYKNFADWLTRVIRRDLYNDNIFGADIESPEPQSASFSIVDPNGIASQVSLSLKNQNSQFNISGDLSNLIRLDGGSYSISNVSISGNNLLVNFSRNSGTNSNPTSISYRGHENSSSPMLSNSSGMSMIYFDKIPITGVQNPPPPPPPSCIDIYEPNNSLAVAKSVTANENHFGTISSATDQDWYRFRTWTPWVNVKVSIWGMTGDYDLFLYDQNGALLASSEKTNTTSEAVSYNGPADFQYRLKIASKDGSFNPDACYTFRIQATTGLWPPNSPPYQTSRSSSNVSETVSARTDEMKLNLAAKTTELNVYPNPARQNLLISYPSVKAAGVELRIFDLTGRELLTKKVNATPGQNQFQLNVSTLTPGSYLLQIRNESGTTTKKIIIGSK